MFAGRHKYFPFDICEVINSKYRRRVNMLRGRSLTQGALAGCLYKPRTATYDVFDDHVLGHAIGHI